MHKLAPISMTFLLAACGPEVSQDVSEEVSNLARRAVERADAPRSTPEPVKASIEQLEPSVFPSEEELASVIEEEEGETEAEQDGLADSSEPADAEIASESEDEEPASVFALRRGETLHHFARWTEIPVEVIAERSGLDLAGQYTVGTEVIVPVAGEALQVLEDRREAHQVARLEAWLDRRDAPGDSVPHTVRTGETAWNIAQQHHRTPVWVIESYNPEVDLDRLTPGTQLQLPKLPEALADAP